MSVARNIADLIHTDGNVGIGTHTPSSNLEIYTDSSQNIDVNITNARGNTADRARLQMTAGNQIWRFENDQNLDVFKLRDGTAGRDVFNIYNGANNAALNINSTGVGINTTPSAPLHVRNSHTISANTNTLLVDNYATGQPAVIGMRAVADNGGAGNTGAIYFDAGADGSAPDNMIAFNADHQTDTNYDVVIKGNGNVGIGTVNPESKLHVIQSGNPVVTFERDNGTPHLYFRGTGGTSGYTGRFYMDNGAFQLSQGDAVGNQSGNIWLHGLSNGNVGIGTNTPDEKLHVSGGNISAGDSTTTFDDGGSTRYIGVGSNSGGDALFIAHSSGYGVAYFGYEAGNDRLIIATDNGGGNNTIEFSVNAGSTATGSTDNLNSAAANLIINNDGITLETQTVATLNSSATVGTIAYVSDDSGNLYYKYASGWKSFTASIGTAANPAANAVQLANQGYPDGYYYIAISGYSAQRMYVDNSRNGGGWVLMARVTLSSNQAHHNNNSVNVSNNNGPQYQATSTAKMSDAFMNAYRTASPYTGSTAYWMETTGGFTSSGSTILNNFIDTNATVDTVSSADQQNARTRVATTFEGSISDRAPNTGTRGFGDHHTGASYFAYQRHPEQGNNSGFRNDAYGGTDGNLWIK